MEIPVTPLCPKCDSRNNVHRVLGPRLEEVEKAWNCLTCQHRWLVSE
jgi:DNA-directed RNA polymerase subunit M/transcription elongation factor TFIIS